mgnify:CR=1 FL=1
MGTTIALVVLFIMNIFTFIYTLHIGEKINKTSSTNKEPIKKFKRGLIFDSKVNRDNNEKIPYTLEVSIIEESDTKYKIKVDNITFNRSDHIRFKDTIIKLDNHKWVPKNDVELIVESKAVVRKEKMSKLFEDDKK